MFGIIVGTHGQFAPGILQSCEMIFGKRDKLRAVTLMPGESPDDVIDKYEQAIKELGNPDKVLFFNDLMGGVHTTRLLPLQFLRSWLSSVINQSARALRLQFLLLRRGKS